MKPQNPDIQNPEKAKIWMGNYPLKSRFWTFFSMQNPNCANPNALYALARPVGHVAEFGILTAIQNPDVYKPENKLNI